MNSDATQAAAELSAVVGVPLSFIYVGLQVRPNTAALKAGTVARSFELTQRACLTLWGEADGVRIWDQILTGKEVDPENENVYGWVCGSYLRLGRFEEGAEACEMAQKFYPDWAYDALEHAFRGEEDAALQDLERVVNAFPGSGDVSWCAAEVHAVLGDIDGALRWLRRGIEEERSFVSQLPGDPAWDVLRSDPRFDEIRRETGFED